MASDGGQGHGPPGQGGGDEDEGGPTRSLDLHLAQAAVAAAASEQRPRPTVRSGTIGGGVASQMGAQGKDDLRLPFVPLEVQAEEENDARNVTVGRVGSAVAVAARGVVRPGAGESNECVPQRRLEAILQIGAYRQRKEHGAAAAAAREHPETAEAAVPERQGGQRSSQKYDPALVEQHVRARAWPILEKYLTSFITSSGHDPKRHPSLILHCLRGRLVDELSKGSYHEARTLYLARIAGSALRNVITPYADKEKLTSDVDGIQSAMFKGQPIEEYGADVLAEKINDYMRFYFPRTIGHPLQGKSVFWRFAMKLGRLDGNTMFRCLLCQAVFQKGSLHEKMQRHLKGGCAGMTEHALNLFKDIRKAMPHPESNLNYKGSAHKRSSSAISTSKSCSRPAKVIKTQRVGTSSPGSEAPLETRADDCQRTKADIGTALLKSLSLVLSISSSKKLEDCLGIIIGTTSPEVKQKEAMKARGVLLDIILSTDLPKEFVRDLSNYFANIISQSLQQIAHLPSEQVDVQPTYLKLSHNADEVVHIDKSALKASVLSAGMQPATSSEQTGASTSTNERAVISCPTNYAYCWDDPDAENDNEDQ